MTYDNHIRREDVQPLIRETTTKPKRVVRKPAARPPKFKSR